MAERMEFELPVFPVGRIGSESGPPNLAAETNPPSCPPSARNPSSPVPIRLCPSPKTPRKRGVFWDAHWLRAQSLCNRRLVGGGQTSANPSLGAKSLLSREDTGNSAGSRTIAASVGRRTVRFRPSSAGFP
jgi:hypothetical protein